MKKLIFGVALLASLAFAQTVAINDTLYVNGGVWTGTISVCWPAFTAASGAVIAKGCRDSTVTSGAVAVSLYPSEGASPAISYSAHYRTTSGPNRGVTWDETWAVASSPSIQILHDVRRSSSTQVFPSEIVATGLPTGTYCWSVVNATVTGLVACSGLYQAPITGAPGSWPSTFTPPAPGVSTLGGVKSGQCTTTTGKLMGYDTSGDRICESDQTGGAGGGIPSLITTDLFGATPNSGSAQDSPGFCAMGSSGLLMCAMVDSTDSSLLHYVHCRDASCATQDYRDISGGASSLDFAPVRIGSDNFLRAVFYGGGGLHFVAMSSADGSGGITDNVVAPALLTSELALTLAALDVPVVAYSDYSVSPVVVQVAACADSACASVSSTHALGQTDSIYAQDAVFSGGTLFVLTVGSMFTVWECADGTCGTATAHNLTAADGAFYGKLMIGPGGNLRVLGLTQTGAAVEYACDANCSTFTRTEVASGGPPNSMVSGDLDANGLLVFAYATSNDNAVTTYRCSAVPCVTKTATGRFYYETRGLSAVIGAAGNLVGAVSMQHNISIIFDSARNIRR